MSNALVAQFVRVWLSFYKACEVKSRELMIHS